MAENSNQKTTELNILHTSSDKPFETVMVEPDETTTEVIVDSDGTKRIIVKKIQHTVVSRQQVVQQKHLTTTATVAEGAVPVTQSFSQVTLQGQQSSTTVTRGDGQKETLTSQSYGGKITSGIPGGEVNVQEFYSQPEYHHSLVQPPEIQMQEGDVVFVDQEKLIPTDKQFIQGEEINTSSSTVRAVVQQVTRKIIRKTRKIIRRIVIVDGKEQVTEEIIEEPEEVEVTEEGIPRVSINVTRREDGVVVGKQDLLTEPVGGMVQTEPEVIITENIENVSPQEEKCESVTDIVLEQDLDNTIEQTSDARYVFDTALTPVPASPKTSTFCSVVEFIEHEKSAPSPRKFEEAPALTSKTHVDETVAIASIPKDEVRTEITLVPEIEEVSVEQSPTVLDYPLPDVVDLLISSDQQVTPSSLVIECKITPTEVVQEVVKPKEDHKDINTQFIQIEKQSFYQQEPIQEISLHISETTGKPLVIEPEPEHFQAVEFSLSLEEKQPKTEELVPKVSMTMKVEEQLGQPELLQKDVYVSLPVNPADTVIVSKTETPVDETSLVSEVDHGGTKSRKKKKRKDGSKTTTPDETRSSTATAEDIKEYSVETSLAESTDIIIPDDSEGSVVMTPKFTEEVFDVTSEHEDSETISKETGYEPEEKTTVDENLLGDDQQKMKKRKKRKKQKVKVKGSEESFEPKSLESSSPEQFSDDEIPVVEEPTMDVKLEPDSSIHEAHSDKISSVNESYESFPTPSEANSVKIVEESIPVSPETESLESITSKIVTTVPVIEAVITQEEVVQTSPEAADTKPEPKKDEEFKIVVEMEQVCTQTTPEPEIESLEISIQTSPEVVEIVAEVIKPETLEMSTQVDTAVKEDVTQTSTPEKSQSPEVTTTETFAQTISPVKVELIETTVQTVTPDVETVIRSDSQMQTASPPPLHEEYAQTITPDVSEVQIKETLESSTQIYPHEVSEAHEEYAQTSPPPFVVPLDETTQTSTPELKISPEHKPAETIETTVQTTPVVFSEIGERTSPTLIKPSYDVHVQALVTLPSDKTDTSEENTSSLLEVSTKTSEDLSDTVSGSSEDELEEFTVDVQVDGKRLSPSLVTTFLDSERRDPYTKKRIRKKRKRTKSKQDPSELVQSAGHLDPSLLYSEIVKRGSRSSSPVPEHAEQSSSSSSAAPSLDQCAVVNISLTIRPESPVITEKKQIEIETPITSIEVQPSEVLVTELRIDTGINPELTLEPIVSKTKKPVKQKGKSKHKSSVTIEEVMSPELVDTPLTPGTDVSSEISSPIWTSPLSTTIIEPSSTVISVRPFPDKTDNKWGQAEALERLKNLQNVQKTHLSEILLLASLDQVVTDESIEKKSRAVQENLSTLKTAIHKGDVVIIQETIITTVETMTTWLQTIEYRIYMQRQQTADGPSHQKLKEFSNLKGEIGNIEAKVKELETALEDVTHIYNENERERMRNYVRSLKTQLKAIEEVAQQNEQIAADDLVRWQQFIDGLENLSQLINGVKKQLNLLIESDASPQTKLHELEDLETENKSHMVKTVQLISTARGLMRDFSNREIPLEVYTLHETTKQIDHHVSVQREKALHLLALAEEYVQTLKEFEQIIDIADALVESPISVRNLEHLEEEVQNHRKFFINLSHCRAILESLEENLDSETRASHSPLHQTLYQRASVILDRAAGRLQQMSLAASRWTVLEQGMRDEHRWLEVAKGRVPDLTNVTSVDYDQYINLYQSLSLDIAHHHSKLSHLSSSAHQLQELISCTSLEETYMQPLEIIMELYENVSNKLKRLISFRDSWNTYNIVSDKLEYWLKSAEHDLSEIETLPGSKIPLPGNMRQFWELKAQHEVHNKTREESGNALEKSMQIIPVADEMLQRKFYSELEHHWQRVSKQINDIQTAITENISAPDVPINEKLAFLQKELEELKSVMNNLGGVIKNEEELNLYVERLQVMQKRLETIQNELGKLGLLSAVESEKVGVLLALSRSIEIQIFEELDGSIILKERLQTIQRGLARVRRTHQKLELTLSECEKCEKLGADVVEKAVNDCSEVGEELVTLWQDLMGLRQLLHTLPMRLRVTVSPIKVERDISQLQDDHTMLEKKCGQLLAVLRSRLALWQRFERQLELVQRSIQEADFMMELFTVQGQVDYDRLLKATERLEGLSGDLTNREALLEELRSCAEPLASSCAPEVSAHVEAAVTEAVTAWEDTRTNLRELCTRYHKAADLWNQYRDATHQIREWCDTQMETVNGLEPEETIKTVKVCEETLAAHTTRLAELKNLVSGIASAVGLDGNALLGGEVDALGLRLQDVRESLTVLADVVDAQAQSKTKAQEDFVKTKNYLTSVQKSVTSIQSQPESDLEQQLETLRDHLLQLSKAENTIQKIRDNTLDSLKPTRTESSVIEILQLWQHVFKETFQEYHRLSTRLVKNEDSVAALKLWQEYLLHVQQFLLGSIPNEYDSLAEHQRLLEMHHNLLKTQQSILQPMTERDSKIELNVMEQLNSLTNAHNETLSKIIDRLAEVKNRLSAWDNYRFDQNRLLSWLKNMEKEREHLQLRYIHIRRVPKISLKIQHLLSEIPYGEEQTEQLQKQQAHLLRFSDDAFSASIRMEHVAIKQRISNLRAGLETWKQFLEKISALIKTYDERVTKLQDVFNSFQETITTKTKELPNTHSGIVHKLDLLRQMRDQLSDLTKDLEQLGVTQEQLKECVSPMDMKTISQQMWILWHQQGDLDHQLTTLCHQLEERLGLRSVFEARHSRFVVWAENLAKHLEDEEVKGDPNEVLRKLETELQTEMSLKNHEYNWLTTTGEQLVSACGEDYSDVVAKQNLRAKTDEVRKRWEGLENLGKNKISKIQRMTQTVMQLELRIAEIKSWLHQTEIRLSKPLIFNGTSEDAIDKLTQEYDALKKSIEKESNVIGEVINLWELLKSDTELCETYFNAENISSDIQNIEKRWKVICGKSAERKQKIYFVWKLLLELLRLSSEQEQWLKSQENCLKDLDKPVDTLTKDEILETIGKVENLIKEMESKSPTFEILDQTYSKLVKTSGIDPNNIRKLIAHVRQLIIKWHDVLPKAHKILQVLERELALYKEFVAAHGNAVMSLTRIDALLTELQHLSTSITETSLKERLSKLEVIDQHLTNQNPTLENADKLGLLLMQKRPKEEIPKIQEMIDEYQSLWKDILERIVSLKSELNNQRKEVDECVQVETLKFEQDTAVQVNTLPPQLQRLTSITPKDAYMVELASAIGECTSNVNNLENLIEKSIPQQGSSELHLIAKRIFKLRGVSQSSIELMNHLHDVLVNECGASDEEARTIEVESLTRRFNSLVPKAKQKEAKIRELSEAGRLLCPLCTKRNWAQLDNDLWRLEQWLQVAEGIQGSQSSPPSNIELLEDVIQDHREFLLDLESHKSIIRSLNIVGTHLADHSEDTENATKLRERLDKDNKRWDSVCVKATLWQTVLQKALMDNRQFHVIVEELCTWLETTENEIKAAEPIDITVDTESINNKFERFCLLKSELEHCEPRVLSLQENANELLRFEQAPEGSMTICIRLNELRLKLQSLIRLTRVYVLKLGAVLGRDPNELGLGFVSPPIVASPSVHNYDLPDHATPSSGPSAAPDDGTHTGTTGDDLEINTTVLRRGYRFLGRVIRASLPIQAVMLLLLGVSSLVPYTEDDYACSLATNFANNFYPTLRHPDGPPPV